MQDFRRDAGLLSLYSHQFEEDLEDACQVDCSGLNLLASRNSNLFISVGLMFLLLIMNV